MTDTDNSPDQLTSARVASEGEASPPEPSSFWNRHKAEIGLAAVVLYVFLLALGTVGELFDIEWILDLPLFRPPGKY